MHTHQKLFHSCNPHSTDSQLIMYSYEDQNSLYNPVLKLIGELFIIDFDTTDTIHFIELLDHLLFERKTIAPLLSRLDNYMISVVYHPETKQVGISFASLQQPEALSSMVLDESKIKMLIRIHESQKKNAKEKEANLQN